MTEELPDFDADTTLTPLGGNRFGTTLLERWNIAAGPNGGYLAALVARGMTDVIDEAERALRSITVHYLSRPAFDDVEIEVTTLRTGRSLSTMRAEMTQNGKTIATALAAFSKPWPTKDEWQLPLSPHAHDEGIDHDSLGLSMRPPVARNWDGVPIVDAPFFSGEGSPRVAQWIRATKPRPLDALELVAICDAVPPAGFPAMKERSAMPTVDLTVHIRAALPLTPAPTDPRVYAECVTHHIADGFADEDCHVWSADGRLLAQSRQLAITQ